MAPGNPPATEKLILPNIKSHGDAFSLCTMGLPQPSCPLHGQKAQRPDLHNENPLGFKLVFWGHTEVHY